MLINKQSEVIVNGSRREALRHEPLRLEFRSHGAAFPLRIAEEASWLTGLLQEAVHTPTAVRGIRLRDSGEVHITLPTWKAGQRRVMRIGSAVNPAGEHVDACGNVLHGRDRWRYAYSQAQRFLQEVVEYGKWAAAVAACEKAGIAPPEEPHVGAGVVSRVYGTRHRELASRLVARYALAEALAELETAR